MPIVKLLPGSRDCRLISNTPAYLLNIGKPPAFLRHHCFHFKRFNLNQMIYMPVSFYSVSRMSTISRPLASINRLIIDIYFQHTNYKILVQDDKLIGVDQMAIDFKK